MGWFDRALRGAATGVATGAAAADKYIIERGQEERAYKEKWSLEEFAAEKRREEAARKFAHDKEIKGMEIESRESEGALDRAQRGEYYDYLKSIAGEGGTKDTKLGKTDREALEVVMIDSINSDIMQTAGLNYLSGYETFDDLVPELRSVIENSGNITHKQAAKRALDEVLKWRNKLRAATKTGEGQTILAEFQEQYDPKAKDDFASFMARD